MARAKPAFRKSYDVIVAGGGVAGAAAALAAARAGVRTALVEKPVILGGLATSGLVNVYLPLCDGCGHQVMAGMAEEFLQLSLRYGPGDVPPEWRTPGSGQRYLAVFSPASFVLALDEALVAAGVDLWFDALACLPLVRGGRMTGVEIETKSGRGCLQARCLVDATGEADLAVRAGAPCAKGENWMSLWALQASLASARKAVKAGDGTLLLEGTRIGACDTGDGHPAGMRLYDGTDGKEVSEFVLTGRRLLRERYVLQQAEAPEGRKQVYPVTLPSMAQFRTTRRIRGQKTLRFSDHGRPRNDAIGLIPDWRKPGPVWAVPYGTLVPKRIRGLLAAGRCIDSVGDAWNVARVIPPAALTGEAAGLAAALAVKKGVTPDRLRVEAVRQAMADCGNLVDLAATGAKLRR